MGDDQVAFQPKQSTNLQENPPPSGESQDQTFQSVTMSGSGIAGAEPPKSYEIISSAWEVPQTTLALPASHRPQDWNAGNKTRADTFRMALELMLHC